MLSLLTQSNRLKYFLVDCSYIYVGLYIYICNKCRLKNKNGTYTGIHYCKWLFVVFTVKPASPCVDQPRTVYG